MLIVLHELYAHQVWADARQWGAILTHGPARQDPDLFARLVHLHAVQRAWLGRWQDAPVPFAEVKDFPDLPDLLAYAKEVHAQLKAFLAHLDEEDLQREVAYRDIHGKAWSQPLGDLMLHLALHSQYHRGQQATRLRTLGAGMPPTDLVVWHRLGRPMPEWPEA